MASKSTAASRLKKLAKQIPDDAEFLRTLLTWQAHNDHAADRAIAIVGAAFVEYALKIAILSRLRPLKKAEVVELFEGESAPLRSFSGRIRLGHAMGIFGQVTRNDLERMRAVRNSFAHASGVLSFDTPEIADLCKGLVLPEKPIFTKMPNAGTPKARYVAASWHIAALLRLQLMEEAKPTNPFAAALGAMFGLERLP
jgi:hypothetical protein